MNSRSLLSVLIAVLFFSFHLTGQVTPGDSIHAIKYVIDLEDVDMDTKEITANTTITLLPLVNNLDIIQLQLMDLTVDSVFVNMLKVTSFTHADEIINIPLQAPISPGDTTDVLVYYHGQPFHESWGGFHFDGPYAFNLGVGISWIPHNLGQSWFPCIDDFTDRAVYEVKATVPDDKMAIGGGELLQLIDNGNGTHTYRWYINNPIPTYLVSVAIGEYALVQDLYNGIEREIPITYYVLPGDTLQVPGTFARMHEVLALFEAKFGAYDWHRIGYVGTDIGAMEHATNIAYPHFAINGNASYEDLYVHELSHMWFGDKVTCDKAEEMWINEGWASFCQYYYTEVLDGTNTFKTAMRNMHAGLLYDCHLSEGGYIPLNDIPQNLTYGRSAYDRGATVVQAMRGYLGDAVFFPACEDFLEDLAFTSVSSYDMEANFTQNTGVDMSGFFNNYVYHGGTPGYTLDSFNVVQTGGNWDVSVYVKQRRHGPAFMGDGNIIGFTVKAQDWNQYSGTVQFDGETGHATVNVPFEPVEVFLDMEERYMDATVDNFMVIDELGTHSFPKTYFVADVTTLTDSIVVQATHNYTPPDTLAAPIPGFRLSDYRHWTVKWVGPEPFSATGKFGYNISRLDNTLISSPTDSLVILYRKDAGMSWTPADFTQDGTWAHGSLWVENMQAGDYAMGVWDLTTSTEESFINEPGKILSVFPNPSSGKFTFSIGSKDATSLEIYSYSGQKIDSMVVENQHESLVWVPKEIPGGSYLAVLRNRSGKIIDSKKILFNK